MRAPIRNGARIERHVSHQNGRGWRAICVLSRANFRETCATVWAGKAPFYLYGSWGATPPRLFVAATDIARSARFAVWSGDGCICSRRWRKRAMPADSIFRKCGWFWRPPHGPARCVGVAIRDFPRAMRLRPKCGWRLEQRISRFYRVSGYQSGDDRPSLRNTREGGRRTAPFSPYSAPRSLALAHCLPAGDP